MSRSLSISSAAVAFVLLAPIACDGGAEPDGMAPSAASPSGGKADDVGLDPFACTFASEGAGRIEDLALEVKGATLTPAADGYDLAMEIHDFTEGETKTMHLQASTQSFRPTVTVTSLSAAWEVQADESPFFDVSLSLNSTDGVTYDDSDSLGLRLETFGLPMVCTRSGGEQTADDKLTAHVAANFDEVAKAGAAAMGIDVDSIDANLDTLRCHAVTGHTLPGTDGVGAGTCTVAGVTAIYGIIIGMHDGEVQYTMSPIACEDSVCPGTDEPVGEDCCRTCVDSQACGDSCISMDSTCNQAPGCACQG